MKVRLRRLDPGSDFASGSNSASSRRMDSHRHWQPHGRAAAMPAGGRSRKL